MRAGLTAFYLRRGNICLPCREKRLCADLPPGEAPTDKATGWRFLALRIGTRGGLSQVPAVSGKDHSDCGGPIEIACIANSWRQQPFRPTTRLLLVNARHGNRYWRVICGQPAHAAPRHPIRVPRRRASGVSRSHRGACYRSANQAQGFVPGLRLALMWVCPLKGQTLASPGGGRGP